MTPPDPHERHQLHGLRGLRRTDAPAPAQGARGPAPSSSAIPASAEAKDLPPPSSKADAQIGKTIDGRYVVERILGEGGMGIVYAARHKMIDKRVAIKVLRGGGWRRITSSTTASSRKLARRAPSEIPTSSTSATSASSPTDRRTSSWPVPRRPELERRADRLRGADARRAPCSTSASRSRRASPPAHAASIVHRDLKPDNVMLINRGHEKDFVKVLDFGIAKVGGSSRTR